MPLRSPPTPSPPSWTPPSPTHPPNNYILALTAWENHFHAHFNRYLFGVQRYHSGIIVIRALLRSRVSTMGRDECRALKREIAELVDKVRRIREKTLARQCELQWVYESWMAVRFEGVETERRKKERAGFVRWMRGLVGRLDEGVEVIGEADEMSAEWKTW
ncbi:hypothetical protein EX30DRAFT_364316 [Ascodesmis nigricans]|uniref:Uncharacterized protein n=1 Tax=Ascodesmis nigricans TaxID=341454 RepID=A0A4S2MVN1_9PEZI|nr:hypothetical protein EX30DRAFT_364316 [Ascodesmis nigricans]